MPPSAKHLGWLIVLACCGPAMAETPFANPAAAETLRMNSPPAPADTVAPPAGRTAPPARQEPPISLGQHGPSTWQRAGHQSGRRTAGVYFYGWQLGRGRGAFPGLCLADAAGGAEGDDLSARRGSRGSGRAPLAGRQHVHLLRCGSKLLLVSVTPGGAETLTEVTDPAEVDRLAGLCRQAHPKDHGQFSPSDSTVRLTIGERQWIIAPCC